MTAILDKIAAGELLGPSSRHGHESALVARAGADVGAEQTGTGHGGRDDQYAADHMARAAPRTRPSSREPVMRFEMAPAMSRGSEGGIRHASRPVLAVLLIVIAETASAFVRVVTDPAVTPRNSITAGIKQILVELQQAQRRQLRRMARRLSAVLELGKVSVRRSASLAHATSRGVLVRTVSTTPR